LNYYQKKLINPNYELGQLPNLTPDYELEERSEFSRRTGTYSYIIISIISYIFVAKTKSINCLFFLTILLFIKINYELNIYYNKYNTYGEEINQ
jgi:uncharacterized membrane protein YdbT with pleckstrin-like domain